MNSPLIAAGALLYGRRWQADTARYLEVSRRTIVNWTNGVGAPGPDHWRRLAAMLRAKAKGMDKLAAELDAAREEVE